MEYLIGERKGLWRRKDPPSLEGRILKAGSWAAGHRSQGGLLPTFQPLVAPAVHTLVQGVLQAGVDSCVCHWLLVDLTARVSMREASVEVRDKAPISKHLVLDKVSQIRGLIFVWLAFSLRETLGQSI